MGRDAPHVRGKVGVVLRNDKFVPRGDNIPVELGDCGGGGGLEGAIDANNVRLHFCHVWVDCRVRERVPDERVCIWLQNVVTGRGNRVANRGVWGSVGILAEEE